MNWRQVRIAPADAALGVGVGLLGLAETVTKDVSPFAVAFAALLTIPMLTRAVLPEFSTVVVVALLAGLTFARGQETPLAAAIALVAAVGTLAALRGPARSAPLLGSLLAAVAVMIAIEGSPLDVAFASFLYGGAWLVGAELHRRRAQTRASNDRAAQALLVLDTETAAARSEERLRIARELHDVVAHSLSVVTLHTQAVRRRLAVMPRHVGRDVTTDAERNQAGLQAAEEAARDALAELRRLFGLMRSDDPPSLEPLPGLAQIDRLAGALGSAGVLATVNIDDDLDLTPGLDLAVYRVVQEATTNILKHAGARNAHIVVKRQDDTLQVTVSDDGVGVATVSDRIAAGHGLTGLQERVALYGGSLRTGGDPGTGFRVEALMPLREDS